LTTPLLPQDEEREEICPKSSCAEGEDAPKRAPNLNPVERLVNKLLKSAVCTNRYYSDIDDVIRAGRRFLTKYKWTFRT